MGFGQQLRVRRSADIRVLSAQLDLIASAMRTTRFTSPFWAFVLAWLGSDAFGYFGRRPFVQAILQSPAHVIGTVRSKQDYVLSERNGKMVPEKVGLKGVTREGMDYEFTLVIDLDIKHNAITV